MSLSNVTRRLTAVERAREPRDCGVIAWFDGYGQAHGWRPMEYPRRITTSEAVLWREGWDEGKRELRCYNAHGFGLCTQQAHDEHPDKFTRPLAKVGTGV